MVTWKTLLLQDSSSPLMEQLSFFHDHALLILIIITILVGQLLIGLFFNKYINRYLLEGQMIELIWTILPAITLIFIALPSLKLIYILDEVNNPSVSIKTMGHQWYWSYEYSDFKNIEFDSYMIPSNELNSWNFRLLDVDNRIMIPFKTQVRMLISSADVIHSWTIPSMGVKLDATPGRLNQVSFTSSRTGLFYGQCSEICGANHSFMPIVLESIAPNYFLKWMSKL
nr:cytochrome c oxidase subunit II [Omadius sp.]